jgi:hypothetical protein
MSGMRALPSLGKASITYGYNNGVLGPYLSLAVALMLYEMISTVGGEYSSTLPGDNNELREQSRVHQQPCLTNSGNLIDTLTTFPSILRDMVVCAITVALLVGLSSCCQSHRSS